MNRLRRLLGSAAVGLVLAASAQPGFAADLTIPGLIPGLAVPPPPAAVNWTGFYIGGDVGSLFTEAHYTRPNSGLQETSIGTIDGRLSYGAYGGFNYQVAPWVVLGIETNFNWTSAAYYRELGFIRRQLNLFARHDTFLAIGSRARMERRPQIQRIGAVSGGGNGPSWRAWVIVPPMSRDRFLCVNAFLASEMDARAIKSAMELGILDKLSAGQAISRPQLAAERRISPVGLRLLIELLEANNVVTTKGALVALTPAFREALEFRDLLETRIAFSDQVWPDVHTLFTALLTDVPQFMARSKVFELFRYDRCLAVTPENMAATKAWTRFTTCLTKYEAPVMLDAVDVGAIRRFVDMGGNTGELARQVCERNAAVNATVVDLPVVCALGREHVTGQASAAVAQRIGFFPTDMRGGDLPAPADLVTFKSVLHDWPDADAVQLLERGAGLVQPGGRLAIFERAPIVLHGARLPYSMIPDLVFLHFLRLPDLYLKTLERLGFRSVTYRRVELDIGFHLIIAQRPQ
jgi:SAM-dependent methyltransferase